MPEENFEEINIENGSDEVDIEGNILDLKSSFKRIMEEYDEVTRRTHSIALDDYTEEESDFFNFFVYDFRRYLHELSKEVSDRYIVEMSHKEGTLMVLPYYGFAFDNQDDFFVYYLFSYDFSEVYLTLGLKVEGKNILENIGEKVFIFKKLITDYCGNNSIINGTDFVNLKVNELFEDLKKDIKTKNNNNENTDELIKEKNRLYRQKVNATNYQNATIFAKKYDKNNLPSHEELKKDLIDFLNLFNFIKENRIFDEIKDFEFNRNLIYFGAPGTGKSFELNKDKDILIDNKNYERVTFHPDYSYANFVGTYKPISEDGDIFYEYREGPFMRILKKAIQPENKDNNYLLIIEEINRANVAAVFGDVFQLLDRDENHCSRYEIDVSKEIEDYLGKKKIRIPSNMYIWATMNSADQGVFPMDTAFKRRWEFNYLDINNNQGLIENLKFTLNGEVYYWNELRKAINKELLKHNINEDKLIGPFFAFNEYIGEQIIPTWRFKVTFKNKIIMYLFEDVLKTRSDKLFSGIEDKNLTFGKICKKFDEMGLNIFSKPIKECPKIKVNNSSVVMDED